MMLWMMWRIRFALHASSRKAEERLLTEALGQLVREWLARSDFDRLRSRDILFIDSSHVVKAGSDALWLFLHILPRLAPGVVVHVHDVFWPFEYPAGWLREHRDWTEAYLLHAFLVGNAGWEILLFTSWLWQCKPDLVPRHLADEHPGSFWMRKTL